MRATFQNSGTVLSIGVFFSLMIVGLASTLPAALSHGLTSNGVPAAQAQTVASLPPVSTLFAAFLGFNPIQNLLGPHTLSTVSAAQAQTLTGKQFFPHLIARPFHHGLVIVFTLAAAMAVIAAFASLLRGSRYIHEDTASDVRPSVDVSAAARTRP